MAQIVAFKGIRYNKEKIKDLSRVIAPPYDVISPSQYKSYYQAHRANIVRLILPDGDGGAPGTHPLTPQQKKLNSGEKDNAISKNKPRTFQRGKYSRAGKQFRQWLNEKILIQDEEPAVYVYQQKYNSGKRVQVRIGFFPLVKIEDFSKGVIFPHEETYSTPKKDRMRLLRRVKANLSPVFGLYDDPGMKVRRILGPTLKKEPLFKIKDIDGIEHRLWKITRPDLIRRLKKAMRFKKIYIADGHHRYETALTYCRENEARLRKKIGVAAKPCFQLISGRPSYCYIMMCLVSLEDEGLVILPTHRVLLNSCCGPLKDKEIINKLKPYFDIKIVGKHKQKGRGKIKGEASVNLMGGPDNLTKNQDQLITFLNELISPPGRLDEGRRRLAMYTRKGNLYLLILRKRDVLDAIMPDKTPVYRNLDVNILHRLIIEHILGLKPAEGQIIYTRDEKEALGLVERKDAGLAFLLNPPRIHEVRQVALSGEKMPQKSTYFYPKIPTGLVINKL